MGRSGPFWAAPRIWPASTVFIIGGGPSLFGFDWSLIENRQCIAVNGGHALGWPPFCYFSDVDWYENSIRERGLVDYGGMLVTIHTHFQDIPGVHCMRRGPPGLNPNPDTLAWNLNSGATAINLAYHLGAKRVVLIGFDMKPREEANGTRHNWYFNYRLPKGGQYNLFLKQFPMIARDAEKLGLEIVNATPGSAVTSFPMVKLEDELRRLECP